MTGLRTGTSLALLASVLALTGCAVSGSSKAGRATATAADIPVHVTTVTLPHGTIVSPEKVGQTLYYSASRGTDQGSDLLRYDLKTKETDVVFSAPEDIGSIEANSRWLLWENGRQLIAQSLDTGERSIIASSTEMYSPALENDLAAWIDQDEDRKHHVVVYDLATSSRSEIAAVSFPGFYNNFLAWDTGSLVWTDIFDDVGHYRVFDRATRQIVDYRIEGTEYRYPGYPELAGDRIYSRNFKRTDEWDWTVQQLGFYSLEDKKFNPIVPEGFIADYVTTWADCLAVVDDSMKLTIRTHRDASPDNAGQSVVSTPVDFIDTSEDDILIATYSKPDGKATLVYLIERR